MSTYHVKHDPDGWACNMGWAVTDATGEVLYRGPEWACRYRAGQWNAGRLTMTERHASERFGALVEVLT